MIKLDPELLRSLGLEEYIALDLETTGLEPERAEIIELGAVRFADGEPKERFSSLLRPEGALPPKIADLTGIGPGELEGAPPVGEVLPGFLEFIGERRIVAHKADFDRGFLEAAAARLDIPLPQREWLDTLLLARALLPWARNHKLGTLAEELGLPRGSLHRAAADAERVGLLLLGLLKRGLGVEMRALRSLASLSPPGLRELFQGLVGYRRERGLLGERRAVQAPMWEPRPREVREDFRLDPELIESFFKEDGPLAQKLDSFSERPEQLTMAREVAQAFNNSNFLIAEAGTGTGKSFAYLVPAVLWARGRGRDGRVVVSTNTKNLQDQLFKKDIPTLKEVLGGFQAVLLKGRANYLCLHRWESLLLEGAGELGLAPEALLSIPVWLEETETGDLTENNAFWKGERAWELVKELNDDPNYCLGRECPFYESCFSVRARRAAREAEIVVVNHALLLADLELEHGILGEYKYLIVDEAHNLEEAASEHLTRRLSFWEVNELLTELYRARGGRLGGLLPLLRERIGRSGLKVELKEAILGRIEEGIDAVRGLRRQSGETFARLTEALMESRRIKEEDYPLEHPEKGRYDARLFTHLEEGLEELETGLALLAGALEGIRESLEGLEEGLLTDQKGLWGRTAADLAWTRRLLDLLKFMAAADDEEFVFWFELPAERERFAALYATPFEVADLLYEGLFHGLEAAVFTSATLAVADDFHYLEGRLGLDRLGGRLRARSFGDPFDYRENARLAVPEFLPSPKEEGFHRELAELLLELAARIGRRMMVLFTSHKLLRQVHGLLREAGMTGEVFAQGLGGSRAQLMEEFRHSPTRRAILLGTSSFWEGVDLPGESLEILVLTKLPFPVPGEPVVEARGERIEAQGGDSFQDLFLPQAILKLRQGFGRLIRTHEDRGAVIITDNRIVHQRYGHLFRRSLPLPLTTYYTPSRLLVELEEFFAQGE